MLEAAGSTVELGEMVSIEGMSIDAQELNVEHSLGSATALFFDYATIVDLRADWNAVAGLSPTPLAPGTGLEARILYWSQDSVLAVDRTVGTVAALEGMGHIFLGRGIGGEEPAPPAPPATGSGLAPAGSGSGLPLLGVAAAAGALTLAGAGAFALARIRK